MLRRSAPRRALATVLFTDIVRSTERASELGDRRWRELLREHHRIIRRLLKRHHGREVDTAGDGFFATFQQPADAIECALDALRAVAAIGIEIRAGVHTGEVEPMGRKVGGIAVHIAARILATAEPGEVLTSGTVRDLVSGAGFRFADLGSRPLKGVDGEWRLYRVERPQLEEPAAAVGPGGRTSERRRWLIGAGLGGLGLMVAALTFVVIRLTVGSDPGTTAANRVGSISTDGRLGTMFAVGQGPGAIAVDEAAVWVANTDGGTVSRIDRQGGENASFGAGVPTDLVVAGGLVWVLDPFASTLAVVSPGEARIVETIEVHGRAMAATDEAIWLADDLTDAVHRIDPRTRAVEATIDLPPGSGPSAIAADADSVWVVNGLSGTLSHIDARSDELVGEALTVVDRPTAVAIGARAVWIAAEGSDLVVRVDPATNRVARQDTVCDRPADLAAAADVVWVACLGDGVVWRLSEAGGDPVTTVLGGVPGGIAADGDAAWVTIRES
jgi:class 3 adenylate cyclase/DNA-binding beta-propeller fold protein YncE